MKLKNLIIVGVIILALVLGLIVFITVKSKNDVSGVGVDENLPETTEVEDETIETFDVDITNRTGTTIKEFYLYDTNRVENGELIGEEQLDGKELEDGETITLTVEKTEEETSWDMEIVTDDGNFELVYTLTTDYMFDGAKLDLILDGKVLDAVFPDEENEEQEYEENNDEEEHNEEEYHDEDRDESSEENRENEEEQENNEEHNEEYREDEEE